LLTDTEIRKAKDTAASLYTCSDERSLAIPAIILMSAASPQLAALPRPDTLDRFPALAQLI
jgi:hypothetical protein